LSLLFKTHNQTNKVSTFFFHNGQSKAENQRADGVKSFPIVFATFFDTIGPNSIFISNIGIEIFLIVDSLSIVYRLSKILLSLTSLKIIYLPSAKKEKQKKGSGIIFSKEYRK